MFSASAQSDLFDGAGGAAAPEAFEAPDAAFVEGIRRELTATLRKVEAAEGVLPWGDLTKAYLAEMRFRSISRWLPAEEAGALVAAFDAALERVYAALDRVEGD